MTRLTLDSTMSLDGFIAGPNDDLGPTRPELELTRVVASPTVTHLR
jgi:hypothetical protein